MRVRGAWAVASLMGTVLVAGCVIPAEFEMGLTAPPEFNQRMRIDNEPPNAQLGQDAVNPLLGPYRNGEPNSELVSLLFPDLEGDEERLMQSNCFWISNPANGLGDFVRLSWELILELHRSQTRLDCSSPNRIGLCGLRDPVDGRWLLLGDPKKDPEPCPGEPEEHLGYAGWDPIPIVIFFDDDIGFPISLEGLGDTVDVSIWDALALAELTDPAPDGHRSCPGDLSTFVPFDGPPQATVSYDSGVRCGPGEQGLYATCGELCAARPLESQPNRGLTYRIGAPDTSLAQQIFQPNVMTVTGSSALTRRMAAQAGGALAWRTESSGGESDGRWHENFSPKIRVESVRVYRVEAGVEKPVPGAFASGLVISGSTSQGPVQSWTCTGTEEPDGTVFTLFPSGGCNDGTLLATPTYVHQHLTDTQGPLSQPATWSVVPQSGFSGDVFLEFRVTGRSREGMALSISSPHEFGATPLGEPRRTTVRIENRGGEVAVIDQVYLGGPAAQDYSFVLPADPKLLPLPVAGRITDDVLEGSPLAGAGSDPQLFESELDATGRAVLLTPVDYEGQTLSFNSYDVSFQSGLAFYSDPAAQFDRQPQLPGFRVAATAFAHRTLPFELLPGHTMEAVVTVQPSGYGARNGELHVSAYQASDPTHRLDFYATLLADGVSVPYLEVQPEALALPVGPEGARTWWRSVLVTNPTLFPVDRTFDIVGPDRAKFEVVGAHDPSLTIEPGGAEVFQIRYLLPCPGPVPPTSPQAEFRLTTPHGARAVPLSGFVPPECVAP